MLMAVRVPHPNEVDDRVALEAVLTLYRVADLCRWHKTGVTITTGNGEAHALPDDLIVLEGVRSLAVYTRSFDVG